MWTVVLFKDENLIEAVPTFWVKKNICAWPKKEVKKHLMQRTLPNNLEFNFFPSRILKKNIASLQEAKTTLRKAEDTSDLSTCDEISKTRTKKPKILDPPMYAYNENIPSKFDHSEKIKSTKYNLSCPSFKEKKNFVTHTAFNEFDDSAKLDHYNKPKPYTESSSCPSLKVKRQLFEPSSLSPTGLRLDNIGTSINFSHEIDTNELPRLFSPVEEFLPTNTSVMSNSEIRNLFNLSDSISDMSSPSVGKKVPSPDIVYTSSSPFKVTTIAQQIEGIQNSSVDKTPALSPFKEISDVQQSKFKSNKHNYKSRSPIISESNDLLNKILRVVLKIRYDVESIAQNQLLMDKTLSDTVHQVKDHESSCQEASTYDYDSLLPIETEDQLNEFEIKLKNKPFRIHVINGLKRLAKKTLTATVRQMLRKLFDDELLQLYSYVGQKKKKIFSSLASCSVIFEAVRKIKAFENSTNIDIESPLKVYIAGSAFRKKKE